MSAPPYSSQAEPPAADQHQPSLENLLLRFGLVTLDQLSTALREQTETGTPFADALVRDGIVREEDLARVLERAPAQAPAPQPATAEQPPVQPVPVAVPEPEPDPEAQPDPEPAAAEPEPEPQPEPPPLAAEVEVETPPVFVPAVVPDPEPEPEPAPVAVAPAPDPQPVAAAPAPVPMPAPAPAPEPVFAGFAVRGRLVNGEEIEIATVPDAAEAQRLARDAMRACAKVDGSDWPILNGRYVRPEAIVSIEVAESYSA